LKKIGHLGHPIVIEYLLLPRSQIEGDYQPLGSKQVPAYLMERWIIQFLPKRLVTDNFSDASNLFRDINSFCKSSAVNKVVLHKGQTSCDTPALSELCCVCSRILADSKEVLDTIVTCACELPPFPLNETIYDCLRCLQSGTMSLPTRRWNEMALFVGDAADADADAASLAAKCCCNAPKSPVVIMSQWTKPTSLPQSPPCKLKRMQEDSAPRRAASNIVTHDGQHVVHSKWELCAASLVGGLEGKKGMCRRFFALAVLPSTNRSAFAVLTHTNETEERDYLPLWRLHLQFALGKTVWCCASEEEEEEEEEGKCSELSCSLLLLLLLLHGSPARREEVRGDGDANSSKKTSLRPTSLVLKRASSSSSRRPRTTSASTTTTTTTTSPRGGGVWTAGGGGGGGRGGAFTTPATPLPPSSSQHLLINFEASLVLPPPQKKNKKRGKTSANAFAKMRETLRSESMLNGRIPPKGVVEGFSLGIGASGSFFPVHVKLPVVAYFFQLSDNDDDGATPSPYLGHVDLTGLANKRGYHVPRKGFIQLTLFNPSQSVLKVFVIQYNLEDMPANSQTFLRQRTLYMPTSDADVGDGGGGGGPNVASDLVSCVLRRDKVGSLKEHRPPSGGGGGGGTSEALPIFLRYVVHLRFHTTKSNNLYLHTDIRLIFARDTFEFDPRVATYRMHAFIDGPTNPRYSPKTS
uniref:DUF4210 domain-containing protein n=1 Tax=Hydatigena taeniaeformis TaxID=6205 RepID=A0A0R3X6X3_HYDTA